ncbi:MAG TPA: sigma-54 dependent transcriptional regulator [Alphaproteobacteria bacterium]|nr:sigma-54 dependent transcriptional regulator [Alphaproteobacteria bacterium]
MRLLIVGTLEGHISAAAKIAMARGAKVEQVNTIEAALAALRGGQGADLVMVDVNLNVKSMMESLRSERINAPVVTCGIGNETDAAVEAIKAGAKEYVPLPPDPELIAAILEAATEETSAIIHGPGPMEKMIALADQIAPSDASVLIVGESGTGKELIARQIHMKSKRANERFVSVNCAAIPENLLESELFGHEKGAFTGAIARRIGKFEEASGGTLLLDEISEMDPHLQAKLLRAVQEREIDRVGGSQPVKINIRVIATTNRDLAEEVREGRFREDLLFRINVFTLSLPPLRERLDDINLLAVHFAVKFAELNALPDRPLEPAAIDALRAHHWRGNVRELENTMHRAVLLAEGDTIGPQAIMISDTLGASDDASAAQADASAMVGRTVADVERDLILNTLGHCLGNRTHAANILGISIRTLRNKLKLYSDQGLQVPAPGEGERAAV